MRTPLRLRTILGAVVALGVLNVLGLTAFAAAWLLPATRRLWETTVPLQQLYDNLGEGQYWVEQAFAASAAAVRSDDSAAADRLHASLEGRDRLVGTLPLAAVPRAVRVPMSRAEDKVSRLVVLLDETAALVALGRRRDAQARLVQAESIRAELQPLITGVQAEGLAAVTEGQARVEYLARQLVSLSLIWLLVSVVLVLVALRVFRRRLGEPLEALEEGLARVGQGDLGTTLTVRSHDELEALTNHFNQMTRVLRERAERQGLMAAAGDLLAGVAHEVNNPLMAISATVETRLADPSLSAEARGELERIQCEARRAAQLLRGIVKLVRPGPGRVRPIELGGVVRDAWDLVEFRFRADGVEGRLDLEPTLPPVVAEPHKLVQVFINLLSNAHQAVMSVPPPRRIEVRTFVDGDRVAAEVRDNGTGVPEHVRDLIFRPFFSTQPGGRVGVGLYFSRLLAREFGGDLVHVPGPGAVFRVTLPPAPAGAGAEIQAAQAQRAAAAAPAARSLAGVRILLVDDEPTVRRPIAKFLSLRGAVVREASDGRQALAAVAEEEADVVLADLRMPGMDGLDFYRELRRTKPSLATRVLFLSGDVAQLADVESDPITEERVIAKPIELLELERRILARLA
ncbi:MAG: response regulator [Gemmatimonadetes bacterium]|nr:response regulator [Gemmatimonadota bacterium]